MAEKKQPTVDEAIEAVAEDAEASLSSFKEALAKAQEAMDAARSIMQQAYGKARDAGIEASDRTGVYLADAKKYLGEAKEKMSAMASKGREQADVMYGKSKEQYDALSVRAKELYGKAKERMAEVDFKEKGDQVLEYIRQNPGKSVLFALAAGFLIGFVTRPRE